MTSFLYKTLRKIRPAPLASAIKSALGVGRVNQITPHGVFWIDPVSQFGTALFEPPHQYEPDLARALHAHLPQGGTFLDVGANEGYFSVIAARIVGQGGRVVAVEPQDRLQKVLAINAKQNNAAIEVYQVAISDKPGSVELHLSPDMNTGSTGLSQPTRYAVPKQSIEAITLAQLFERAKLDQVDLMKMDIEGFEYEAVLGSPEIFRTQRVRKFILEMHYEQMAVRGLDYSRIEALLTQCGYRKDEIFTHLWQAQVA